MKDWEAWFTKDSPSMVERIVDTEKEQMYQAFIARATAEGLMVKPRKASKPKEDWHVQLFDHLRKSYPRTTSRPKALKAWNKLKPDNATGDLMWKHFRKAYINTDKEYIPHFSSYINSEEWLTEIIEVKLKLPPDDQLQQYAIDNKLSMPIPGMSFKAYRKLLEEEIAL